MSDHLVADLDQLKALYREPSARVQAKKSSTIDPLTKEVLEASPFFLVATSDADGHCDVSPRGGPPGQLRVLSGNRIAFPDLGGNNLIDSLRNLIENPNAGLLVVMPGRDETLRVDGSAAISTDPELLALWSDKLRGAKCAVVITVRHLFIHCAKAFRRGQVWQPESWTAYEGVPDASDMFIVHTKTKDVTPAKFRKDLDACYIEELAKEQPE